MSLTKNWVTHVISIETRKLISYRADFWVGFISTVVVEFGIAYFLWRSVFEHLGVDRVSGYTFPALLLYYVLSPLVNRVLQQERWGFISLDVYEGTLTRYLLYPIPFFLYKYLAHFAQGLVMIVQLLISLGLVVAIFGVPEGVALTPGSVALGVLSLFFCNYLFFAFSSIFELVSFWADNVWSLSVILRLTTGFLGGGMIPLSFFPHSFREALALTPFPYFLSFPIRVFMGEMRGLEYARGILMIICWSTALTLLARWIWNRGTRQYTGVGI